MVQLMFGPLNLVSEKFDKNTVLFFALLSKASYYSPKAFIHFLRQQQISENIQYTFIEKESSQAYVLWDDENFIVTFSFEQLLGNKDTQFKTSFKYQLSEILVLNTGVQMNPNRFGMGFILNKKSFFLEIENLS